MRHEVVPEVVVTQFLSGHALDAARDHPSQPLRVETVGECRGGQERRVRSQAVGASRREERPQGLEVGFG